MFDLFYTEVSFISEEKRVKIKRKMICIYALHFAINACRRYGDNGNN